MPRTFEPRAKPGPRAGRRTGTCLSLALLAAGVIGCAGARGGGPAADPCLVAPRGAAEAEGAAGAQGMDGAQRAGRPIVVGLPGPVDPAHAPVPRTEAERLVFAQLYETPVRVTCEGRVEPSIAESWHAEEGGRRWTFRLGSDLRDWEGSRVTAADVASSWIAAQEARGRGASADPRPTITGVSVVGPLTLRVELAEPVTIGAFGHPALAVRTSGARGGWPMGSGPFRPRAEERAATRSSRSVFAVRAATGGAPLEFRSVSGDPRDALDAGLDLLVTTDPAVLDYAASASFLTVPLAWDRGHLLLARRAAAGSDSAPGPRLRQVPEEALAALARDAVPVEARPARELTARLAACAPTEDGPPRTDRASGTGPVPVPDPRRGAARAAGDPRIVYAAGDAVGRALAERLVALALDRGATEARWLAEVLPPPSAGMGRVGTAGLSAAAFAEALRAGRDAAYVVRLDHGAAAGSCEALEALLDRAPWLGGAPSDSAVASSAESTAASTRASTASPAGGSAILVPLVETRGTLLLRPGIGGLVVGADGALRLEGLHRSSRADP